MNLVKSERLAKQIVGKIAHLILTLLMVLSFPRLNAGAIEEFTLLSDSSIADVEYHDGQEKTRATEGYELLGEVVEPKENTTIRIWGYKITKEKLNMNTKTYLLIHGNRDNPDTSGWIFKDDSFSKKIAENISALGNDVQILIVDWEELANKWTWGSEFEEGGVIGIFKRMADHGEYVDDVISAIYDIFKENGWYFKDLEIIGHSYGAHIGGILASHSLNNDNRPEKEKILGYISHLVTLDPATEKQQLPTEIAEAWKDLKNSRVYIENYMSSSNFGNVTYTYGTDNFIVTKQSLLTTDNFSEQVDTVGLGSYADVPYTANHSRAHQFYVSTINNDSKVGWGWNNNGGKEHYKSKGVNVKQKKWIGVVAFDGIDCIDNYPSSPAYAGKIKATKEWYNVQEETFSEAITKVGKYVDYYVLDSSVNEEDIFYIGTNNNKVNIRYTNILIHGGHTLEARELLQLKQGCCLKVWLKADNNYSDLSNAKLVGCCVMPTISDFLRSWDIQIELDFTNIDTSKFNLSPQKSYLIFQVAAYSELEKSNYEKTEYIDYKIKYNIGDEQNKIGDEQIAKKLAISSNTETSDLIEGEINSDNNYFVVPIILKSKAIDVAIAFDTSGSMGDNIMASKQNALKIASLYNTNPNAKLGLLEFNADLPGYVKVHSKFTSDINTILNGIDSLPSNPRGSDEYIFYALEKCITGSLGTWREDATRAIILITDEAPYNPCPKSGLTASDIVELARHANVGIQEQTRGDVFEDGKTRSDDYNPVAIYTITPEYDWHDNLLQIYQAITEPTGGKSYSINNADELIDAIIKIYEDISYGDGTVAPWYPSYTFNCEHDHKAHEVWVYDGETLVTKMVVNSTTVTAADYLKAGCAGLESGKEYTFRVYEWEGGECAAESTYTPEYSKPSSGTVTAEATENEEIYNLRISVPSASKFMLTVHRGEEVCFPATEFIFTDTDDKGQIITSKNVKMEFFEAGEYTVEVLGSNLAGTADSPATCTVTIAEEPVISEYAAWPETGYTPEEGQTLLQAGGDMMVTFTWPAITDADHYNLQVYDSYGKLVKTVNNVIDCHTTVKLTDDVYYWVMEAVLFNGNVLSSAGRSFVVAIKSNAPIISRIEAIESEPTKVLLVCDKASSNYAGISYDIQFYTAESGWKNYMDGSAIAVAFSDEDGDGIYTGVIDFKSNVSGAYLLIRPRVNGRLVTDKQTLYRLP